MHADYNTICACPKLKGIISFQNLTIYIQLSKNCLEIKFFKTNIGSLSFRVQFQSNQCVSQNMKLRNIKEHAQKSPWEFKTVKSNASENTTVK